MSDAAGTGLLHELAQRLEQSRVEYEQARVTCGITGISGSGKSSLINAIAGEKIARVNVIEETKEPLEHAHGGVIFIDLPGIGTGRWPQETYAERLGLAGFDCFILVTAHRFYEADIFLYNQIVGALRKPCFVVRNKFDQAVAEGQEDNDLTEEQVRALIEKNIRDNLKPHEPEKIYLTSAKHPERYDLPALIEDIINSHQGAKRMRLVADLGAWSEPIFQEKKKVAERLVGIYAGLSAANALNPIPGLDVSVDLGLLHRMANEVLHIYGLTEKQAAFALKLLGQESSPVRAFKQMATKVATKYATEKAILMLLKGLGKGVAVRTLSKWVPFVGTIISAGIGYRLTYRFGEQLIADCEEAAHDFLNSFRPDQNDPNPAE